MEAEKVIIIRYDELTLKGKIIKLNFIKQLTNNIKQALKQFKNIKFLNCFNYLEIINFNFNDWQQIQEQLNKIFGISIFFSIMKIS